MCKTKYKLKLNIFRKKMHAKPYKIKTKSNFKTKISLARSIKIL